MSWQTRGDESTPIWVDDGSAPDAAALTAWQTKLKTSGLFRPATAADLTLNGDSGFGLYSDLKADGGGFIEINGQPVMGFNDHTPIPLADLYVGRSVPRHDDPSLFSDFVSAATFVGLGAFAINALPLAFGAASADTSAVALAEGTSTVTASAAPAFAGGAETLAPELELVGGAEGAGTVSAQLAGEAVAGPAGAGALSALSTVSQVASTAGTLAKVLGGPAPSVAALSSPGYAPIGGASSGSSRPLNLTLQLPGGQGANLTSGLGDDLSSIATGNASIGALIAAGLLIALVLGLIFTKMKG